MKDYLSHTILEADTSTPDQVWLSLSSVADVVFGFIYIPPRDSIYHSDVLIGAIQEKIKVKQDKSLVLIGDINARFGTSVRNIKYDLSAPSNVVSYPSIPDPVPHPNYNGSLFLSLCADNNLIVVNNAKTINKHFQSKLTYKQGSTWKSEVDQCIISHNLLENIQTFNVLHNPPLPSDHAPITVSLKPPSIDRRALLKRSEELGDHAALYPSTTKNNLVKRSIKASDIDVESFVSALTDTAVHPLSGDVDTDVRYITELIRECAESRNDIEQDHQTMQQLPRRRHRQQARRQERAQRQIGNTESNRWDKLLQNNSDREVWRAINWRGQLEGQDWEPSPRTPSDGAFKTYFETLLNPADHAQLEPLNTAVTIPLLDDPISPEEVATQINQLKANKAAGPDGLSPGLLKLLPVQWILVLTTIFQGIFSSAKYPEPWTNSKLFTIFKKGNPALPSNYRGITLIDGLAKLFDMVLNARLTRWFTPTREQAGAQAGRGCLEHILTLRLITDHARRKKTKLYVTFVDFSAAYDRVPRAALFDRLRRMGCGSVMLGCLVAMYTTTRNIIGTALMTATAGVKQGSPSSCLFFILFLEDMVRMIKEVYQTDGFLGWLHLLVLMDDTVLFATTRRKMLGKIQALNSFCIQNKMKINLSKTKFMVINGNEEDKLPLIVESLTIKETDSYVYLGCTFTSDGNVSSAIKEDVKMRTVQAIKFISFIEKNNDMPFIIKMRVFKACVMSGILYGCETYVGGDLRPYGRLYHMCIKALLGVRNTTNNDLCLLELGLPNIQDKILSMQRKAIKSFYQSRYNMEDDPLGHALRLALNSRTHTSRTLHALIHGDGGDVPRSLDAMRARVSQNPSNSSKYEWYSTVNTNFTVHDLYTSHLPLTNELHRVSWTRLRLSAHSLAIEEGRWNRRGRGRLPIEERLCTCGSVQTERHVIEECPRTQHIRDRYRFTTVEELLYLEDLPAQCSASHYLLKVYKNDQIFD